MRERGFHPIWPSLPGRKSQKLVRNPMANPSCWVTQTFKHPTILYRCTPQLRHPPNTNPSEMLTGIFFFSGKLIRRYLYKTLEIGLMTTPYHKENNGNWPSKSCDRSWSLSFCDSVRRSCRWTQFPVFFCHTKGWSRVCKKPWLKAITTKRGDEFFGESSNSSHLNLG